MYLSIEIPNKNEDIPILINNFITRMEVTKSLENLIFRYLSTNKKLINEIKKYVIIMVRDKLTDTYENYLIRSGRYRRDPKYEDW